MRKREGFMSRAESSQGKASTGSECARGVPVRLRGMLVTGSLLIAAAVGSSHMDSQIASQSILGHPPERVTLDGNHVEVTNGTIALPGIIELSLGAGSYALTLTHAYSSVSGLNESIAGMMDVQTFGPQYM